jgi:hypothetical protein
MIVLSSCRTAAGQAREQAAPDLALRCLERALAQTRDPEVRNEVLAELGSGPSFQFREREQLTPEWLGVLDESGAVGHGSPLPHAPPYHTDLA